MKGAGPSGGLLFLALVAFVGWLLARQTSGALQIVLLVGLAVAVLVLGVRVLRRR